ncbi:11385_t:CDS:2 [Dentiscutata erythropus]|uniref:11385_t:CDS:1 n=1 Tax=Dentiscutata erythropus TaxID=1348616 RepID=A0A9N9NNA8_9GLOM|nr:11385_t:CDS:2 [Dentiscutata erythropus]
MPLFWKALALLAAVALVKTFIAKLSKPSLITVLLTLAQARPFRLLLLVATIRAFGAGKKLMKRILHLVLVKLSTTTIIIYNLSKG